jgi:hypothetical protein
MSGRRHTLDVASAVRAVRVAKVDRTVAGYPADLGKENHV